MSTPDDLDLAAQQTTALLALDAADSSEALEQFYRTWLAPSGITTRLKRGIGRLPTDHHAAFGGSAMQHPGPFRHASGPVNERPSIFPVAAGSSRDPGVAAGKPDRYTDHNPARSSGTASKGSARTTSPPSNVATSPQPISSRRSTSTVCITGETSHT